MTAPQLQPIQLHPNQPQQNPDAPTTPATPPPWLTERALETWQHLAPHHNPTQPEAALFAAYCEAIAEFHDATELIAETGTLTINPNTGQVEASPATHIRDRADRKIAYWSQRFTTGR